MLIATLGHSSVGAAACASYLLYATDRTHGLIRLADPNAIIDAGDSYRAVMTYRIDPVSGAFPLDAKSWRRGSQIRVCPAFQSPRESFFWLSNAKANGAQELLVKLAQRSIVRRPVSQP